MPRTDRTLRVVAVIFAVALIIHAVDHFRRGMAVLQPMVVAAGWLQTVLSLVVLVLVFTGNRWAPHAAAVLGFASAAGFVAAHLLPHWGPLSDSFVHAMPASHVSVASWAAAVLEIAADVALGVAALVVLRRRAQANAK